jgi:pyridoxine 4-dehydrogenase
MDVVRRECPYDFPHAKNHISKPNPLRLDHLRASIDNINSKLQGTKRVDIFESARVDPTRSIEEAITNMKILVEEGKFDHIGLSECSAETLRRANAVHPIASVEIEVSPWSYEEETKKGMFLFFLLVQYTA